MLFFLVVWLRTFAYSLPDTFKTLSATIVEHFRVFFRLTIRVKVGMPESFKVGWYPPKKTGSSHLKIIQKVLIFQTHCPYEGNNWKRFHVLIFLGRITNLPSEETFAPMFERLRTFHQEFMAQFKDTNWQDGFTGFSFQWWQYSVQTIWYVFILIYQGNVFWCKIYVWRSTTLVYKFLFLEKG